jgi:hypothetical protein
MKEFRQKFMASNSAAIRGEVHAETAKPAAAPPQPKLSRRQRRFNATQNRHINEQIKKANELGRPISLRQSARGGVEVVIGKAKKKRPDPGPQPGEVIKAVEGNAMPDLPAPPPHVHGADCVHEGNIFDAADELVESVVGSNGPS